FVAMKTADQLDLQALHRVRERLVSQRTGTINQIRAFLLERGIAVRQGHRCLRLVSQRTGTINQIRAFLLERGIAVRQGHRCLRAELPRILATPSDTLLPRILRIIEALAVDLRRLDERIEELSSEIEQLAKQDAGCGRLTSIPGIGPIISSAIVAAI